MMPPEDVLIAYMEAMHKWELDCASRHEACKRGEISFQDAAKIGKEQFRPIYHKYISAQHQDLRSFHFAAPPDYDPSNEKIVECSPMDDSTVRIRTSQDKGLKNRFVYTLIRQNDGWRIAEKFFISFNGDLIPANL